MQRYHQPSFLSVRIRGQCAGVKWALHIRVVDGVSVAPMQSCKFARMQRWLRGARRAVVFGLVRRGSMRYATQTQLARSRLDAQCIEQR